MALKLFRSTGYSTLLMPGEARVAPHPARLVLWGSLWLALACNVGLWRFVMHGTEPRAAVASVLLIAGGSGVVLNLLGWHRTLKPALTLALILGALFATGLWAQHLPIEALWQGPPRTWLPAWPSFLRWQALVLLLALALVPVVFVWNAQVRRLSGPAQLKANFCGACLGAVLLVAGVVLAR
jgi:glucan phosphoethanolaminetransferase (alkaline phosphatase superfamily)